MEPKRLPEAKKIMRDISFFFNPYGAGEIDGRQIGEFLQAKLNPTAGYQDDICIYVKCQPPECLPEHSYVNIVDGVGLIGWLLRHPRVGVIATSKTAQEYLIEVLDRDVQFIPEHHCNCERDKRTREEITTVGMIGNIKGFDCDLEYAKKRFNDIGMKFIWKSNYSNRFDVINFYKKIDIQINWRPHVSGVHAKLHNPLKLANAASFGIPTVSYPEENYVKEFSGYFLAPDKIEDLFDEVTILKNRPEYHQAYSELLLKKAEQYHIENVTKLYRQLQEDL